MFTYVYNFNYLKASQGSNTVPIFWWWEAIADPNYGWTGASYFSAFISGLLVGFMEIIAWVWFLNGDPNMFEWWVMHIGWWVAVVGMILPWLFASLQLALPLANGGLNNNIFIEYGYNSIFLIIGNLFNWLSSATVHFFFSNRMHCYIQASASTRARIVYKKCPIKRTFGMAEKVYQLSCKELFATGKYDKNDRYDLKPASAVEGSEGDEDSEETL